MVETRVPHVYESVLNRETRHKDRPSRSTTRLTAAVVRPREQVSESVRVVGDGGVKTKTTNMGWRARARVWECRA